MKFKIGDKVKIIKSNTASEKDLNLIGKIVGYYGNLVYAVKFDKEYDFTHNGDNKYKNLYRWYDDENLELVKENTMKTGDAVEILVGKYKGKTGIIVRNDAYTYVEIDNKTICYRNDSVKIVEPKAKLKKDYKFKIGDKVKIIESNVIGKDKNKDLNLIGKIVDCTNNGDIIEFDKEYDFTYNIKHEKRLYRWYNNDNLELIVEPSFFATGNFILIDSSWGVIVDDKILYENGEYDYVKSFNNKDFTSSSGRKVIAILNNCICFNAAKASYSENKNIIYEFFNREKWINDHYQKALSDTNVDFIRGKNKDILCIDKVNHKICVAKCSNNDTFNIETEIAISYAKYLGEEIPKEI